MIDLLRTRRSVRKYTKQAVKPELLDLLKETVLRSPSSKNSNACEFIFIDDQILIEKLSHCRPSGTSSLDTAPLAVVVLSNKSKTGAWTEDCSIASILLQLTAHSIGLGSCWIQIRGRNYYEEKTSETYLREILDIPEYFRILSIVAIGHPQRIPEGKPYSDLDFSRININHLIPSH
jgi:nitroreductase